MRRIILTCCLICGVFPLWSQDFSLHTVLIPGDSIEIGDHAQLQVEISGIQDNHKMQVILPPSNDTVQWLRESNIRRTIGTRGHILKQNFTFTSFVIGEQFIQPIRILITGLETQDTLILSKQQFTVVGVDTSGDLAPIKDIERIHPSLLDYLLLYKWWILLILLLIGIIIYYIFIKKKKQSSEEEVHEIIIQENEWDVAMKKLDALKQERLIERGQVQEYQTQLTFIIREFFENYYAFPALELTTREINQKLEKTTFPNQLLDELSDFLEMSDLVKFAKAIPESEFHARMLSFGYEILHQVGRKDDIEKEQGGKQ